MTRLAALLLTACGAAAPPPSTLPSGRMALTVVLLGGVPDRDGVARSIARELAGADLQLTDAPNVPPAPAPPEPLADALAQARTHYVAADFAACQRALEGPALVPDLLAAGRAPIAARVLFWRVACRVGAGEAADARPDARALAVLGLEVPPDADAASPEVEALFADVAKEIAAAPRATLTVETGVPGASVSFDGRAAGCVTPCAVDLHPGDHVVAVSADGWSPASRPVRLDAPASTARFELAEAPPDLAAAQWSARWAGRPDADSAPSLELLGRAIRARQLVVLDGGAGRLRGALSEDGQVTARAERAGPPTASAPALVRELLVRGALLEPAPPLWKRPELWAIIGGVGAVAVGATALLLYHPPIHTTVEFH